MSDNEEVLPQISEEKEAEVKATADDNTQPTLLSAVKTGNVNCVGLPLERGAGLCEDSSDGETIPVSTVFKANDKEVLQAKPVFAGKPGSVWVVPLPKVCATGGRILPRRSAINEHGVSVLFSALHDADHALVKFLLLRGADPDEEDDCGVPALVYATRSGDEMMVQVLLEHGANPNACCAYDQSALSCALFKANYKLVELLLLHGAYSSETPDVLTMAVNYGDVNLVKLLLEHGATIDSVYDEDEVSALFPAVRRGDESIVQLLLDYGADPNAYNARDDNHILYDALVMGNYNIIQLLLAKGADPNQFDHWNTPMLSLAITGEKYEIAELLLFHGADPNASEHLGPPILNVAVKTGIEKFVQLLLKYGANPNAFANMYNVYPLVCAVEKGNMKIMKILLEQIIDDSTTVALFSAARTGNYEIVQYLIENGADVKAIDENKETILFPAARAGNYKIVELFLDSGVDIGVINKNTETILFPAARAGNYKIVELFLDSGADIGVINKNGETTLCPAIKSENEQLVELLIEQGVDLSVPDKNEETALFHAVNTGNDKIVKVLLRNGANVNARNVKGETALFRALGNGNISEDPGRTIAVMKLLFSHGADVNAKAKDGYAALCHFLRQANLLSTEPIKFLIDSGVDLNARTATGESILHVLLQRCHSNLVRPASFQPDVAPETRLSFVKTKHELVTLFASKDSCCSLAKARDNQGTSTLHVWAANTGNWPEISEEMQMTKDIGQQLIDGGAVVNASNDQNEAPLHLADTWLAAEVLLTNKAHSNQQDHHGVIPLLYWAKSDKLFEKDAFGNWRTILDAGVDPWIADHSGSTLLSIILSKGKFQEAVALVHAVKEKQPGDISKVHTNGNTFLHIACNCESDEVQELIDQLLQAGANPNIQNANKETGLHIACTKAVRMSSSTSEEETLSSVHFWVINRLIQHGADPSIVNVDGQSCLDITSDSPNLQKALKEPVDLLKIPALLPWCQQSERHKKKLAQITRSQRSERAARYQYHNDPIGLGGFGNIYVGVDTSDGREVAIKRIERRRMCGPVDKREVETLVKLKDCEEIVKYLCWFEDDSREHVYIVLELMEGNLEEYIEMEAIDSSSYGALCKHVVTGLDFLHKNKILHRDIKPSNILYKTSPRLCLKIADFGLSTKGSLNAASTTTVMHTNAGTRCWMAPELLRDTTPEHSKESDVFACGLLLHFILSDRKHPFAPADASEKGPLLVQHETVDKIIQNKPSLSKDLSPEGSHLVKHMIEEDKRKRVEASEALKHVLFWSNNKRVKFICAVGNQPEFERPSKFASSQVISDLQRTLGSKFLSQPWNGEIPGVYSEMTSTTRGRGYRTSSAADLVRFVRNCYAHVSDRSRTTPMKKLLLEDFIFFDKFPTLLMDVYHAVLEDKWEHNREEIKYSISEQ